MKTFSHLSSDGHWSKRRTRNGTRDRSLSSGVANSQTVAREKRLNPAWTSAGQPAKISRIQRRVSGYAHDQRMEKPPARLTIRVPGVHPAECLAGVREPPHVGCYDFLPSLVILANSKSLTLLAKLVEAEIPDQPLRRAPLCSQAPGDFCDRG
jgi:hypothetical protein